MLNVQRRIILFLCTNQTNYTMKTLLIVISTLTLLLFSSCEDEMGKGGTSGGGELPGAEKSASVKELNISDQSIKSDLREIDNFIIIV